MTHAFCYPNVAGGDFTCSKCHAAKDAQGNYIHRVKGRGIDLRPTDTDASGNPLPRNTCTDSNCHTTSPHPSTAATFNRHTVRVACQTCHIPKFAKFTDSAGNNVGTEMSRDWTHPVWSATACNGRGGWTPGEVRWFDAVPSYGFFDGTTQYMYQLGTAAPTPALLKSPVDLATNTAAKDYYRLAVPNGSANSQSPDPIAKLYPMKVHTGLGALAKSGKLSGQLIAPSTFIYFTQGSWGQAVTEGLVRMGASASDTYATVNTLEYQTLNHGVEPKANALGAGNRCGNCHTTK